jgi:hypothetical protein
MWWTLVRRGSSSNLSYIYLGSSVCHPVVLSSCHIPVILSVVVAERWAILYVLVIKLTKETRRRVFRGIDFSLFKPNLINIDVHSATCSCSIELYKQSYTLADFLPNCDISRGFLNVFISLVESLQLCMMAGDVIFSGCRVAHLGWGVAQ